MAHLDPIITELGLNLTDKTVSIIHEYMITFEFSATARNLNMKVHTVESLLKTPDVRRYMAHLYNQTRQEIIVNRRYVTGNLIEISERCMQHVTPKQEWDKRKRKMVDIMDHEGNVVYEWNANGALKANELLGKSIAMYTDVIQTGRPLESMSENDLLMGMISLFESLDMPDYLLDQIKQFFKLDNIGQGQPHQQLEAHS